MIIMQKTALKLNVK